MSEWVNPKVNWEENDRFNISDYNRIKNNLSYLKERANNTIRPFFIEDMGVDLIEETSYWDVNVFNSFEKNLDIVNENAYKRDYGTRQTFYENVVFIKYDELNRIESAMLDIYSWMERQSQGQRHVPFVLGRFKEVRT